MIVIKKNKKMKITLKSFLLALVLVFFVQSTQAQFFKKLKERAKQKIEQEAERRAQRRVDRKIDKTFDKTEDVLDGKPISKNKKNKNSDTENDNSDASENMESQEQTSQESSSQNAMNDMLGGMLGGNTNVKTKPSYSFAVTATMEVVNYSKRKPQQSNMKQSYGKGAILAEMTEQNMKMITDFDNEAAIMLQDKTARVMSLSFMKKMMHQKTGNTEENNTAKMEKTGKTKTLNGYLCYQYLITDKNTKVDAWFAPNVNFSYQDYLSGLNKMFGNKKANAVSLLNSGKGYVMEMTMFQKGEKQTEMKVVKLEEKPITINLSDYTIEKMF